MSRDSAEIARDQASHGPRKRKNYYLTEELAERVNSTVRGLRDITSADGEYLPDTASALVEDALWREVLRLERLHHGGRPWTDAGGPLPTGPGSAGTERLSRPRGPYYPD